MKRNIKRISAAFLIGFTVSSCNLEMMQQIGNDARDLLNRNCDCADITVNSESTNGKMVMSVHLTGCDIENYVNEGLRLSSMLIDSVENICEMDQVSLYFIDGDIRHETFFQNCRVGD